MKSLTILEGCDSRGPLNGWGNNGHSAKEKSAKKGQSIFNPLQIGSCRTTGPHSWDGNSASFEVGGNVTRIERERWIEIGESLAMSLKFVEFFFLLSDATTHRY